MDGIHYGAVLVTVLVSFIASSMYYVIFAKQWASVSKVGAAAAKTKRPEPVKGVAQLVRTLVLTLVMAYFVTRLNITDVASALRLSLILWLGFPVVLLSGSVMWENTPIKQAVLHAGDSLLTLLLMGVILTLWR
jgi:hypothetical protein